MAPRSSASTTAEIELDDVERLGANRVAARMRGDDDPAARFEPVDLERLEQRLDEPEMGHALARVDRHLPRPVDAPRRGRDHLADPVRRERERRRVREDRQPLAPPSRPVGDEHVVTEVQLGPEQDPPAARPGRVAGISVERTDDVTTDERRGVRVWRCRPGAHDELAVDDLGDLRVGDLHQVLVGRASLRRPHAGDDSMDMRHRGSKRRT